MGKLENRGIVRTAPTPPMSPQLKRIKTNPEDIPNEPLTGSWASKDVLERTMYTRSQIEGRVREMAKKISADYPKSTEETLAIIGLMSGCYMFMTDLSRELEVPHRVDFISVSSYGMEAVSSANVKVKKDLDLPVAGKDVILVDEMVDTGRTMACLVQWILDKGAKSVKVCVLLNKHERREVEGLTLDYCGWDCADEFLVGYGMDWSHRFRSARHQRGQAIRLREVRSSFENI